MGRIGNRPVDRINTAHPAIKTAANFKYQRWPYNNSSVWIKTFGILNTKFE